MLNYWIPSSLKVLHVCTVTEFWVWILGDCDMSAGHWADLENGPQPGDPDSAPLGGHEGVRRGGGHHNAVHAWWGTTSKYIFSQPLSTMIFKYLLLYKYINGPWFHWFPFWIQFADPDIWICIGFYHTYVDVSYSQWADIVCIAILW